MGGRAPSAPTKSFKQASNPHGNTHIHRQANTNEWTRPAKAQSVGSGGGEMYVRGYKRWQLERRWGGALGFMRSGSRERERRVLV